MSVVNVVGASIIEDFVRLRRSVCRSSLGQVEGVDNLLCKAQMYLAITQVLYPHA